MHFMMNRQKRITYGVMLSNLLLAPCCHCQPHAERVRPAAVAGQFYPGEPEALKQSIDVFLDQAKPVTIEGAITGIWVPHAGYVFSGQVAANGYALLKQRSYDAVVIAASSHHVSFDGASIGPWEAYHTPLGDVPLETEIIRKLRKVSGELRMIPEAHRKEHAVEVQIPFLQCVLPGTPIVPIVLGRLNLKAIRSLAEAIVQAAEGKRVLLVASSDMSHYPDDKNARRADGQMMSVIQTFDPAQMLVRDQDLMGQGIPGLRCTLCGLEALALVMMTSRMMGADKVTLLPYMNSGDITGDHQRVVGYGAAVFAESGKPDRAMKGDGIMEELPLTQDDKRTLIRIARESIKAVLKNNPLPVIPVQSGLLKSKRGAFVTLTNGGRLRGCIGRFDASLPLYEIVSQMAVSAVIHDTRFRHNPVTLNEMEAVNIKISILSPLREIKSVDEIEIGIHGVWITQNGASGTYLPEVAAEQGWTREELLTHCCIEKAGLSGDAWKKGAKISVYSSQIIDEEEIN